jgi:glycerophosphoryl diester phosphodiesterase
MFMYGHRGASALEPENTLRAFAKAIELGVDGLELDLHVTADHVPIVIHDRDLGRTTDGAGQIDRLPLAALERLDAGKGERIPTFEAVLDLIGDHVHLDIEIKQGGIERGVLEVLARFPHARWAISSFDWTSLERVRARSPSAEIWLLAVIVSDALFSTARRLGATAVALYDRAYSEQSAAQLRSAGLDAVIWTVNDPARAIELRDLGAKALCTDDPGTLVDRLAQ